MDLPYPSNKDVHMSANLAPPSQRRSLLFKDSIQSIPAAPPLPANLRKQATSLLEQDLPYELKQLVDREVISFRAQVGREGSHQTLLHACCRSNAVKCLQYLLKTYFCHFPEDYSSWVNSQSKQGVTACMLAVLESSDDCLKMMLAMGGVDIHLIDTNKLSAYQMALNCKNQAAVKMLMEYENGSRRQKSVNEQALSQPLQLKKGKIGLCQAFYSYLLDCLLCQSQPEPAPQKGRKPSKILSLQGLFTEHVQLGFTSSQLGGEVEWRQILEYQDKGNKQAVLYDTFSPFDMEDIGKQMPQILIAFQSLSQHTWLVRRAIQQDAKSQAYRVYLHSKGESTGIKIDGNVPFLTGSNQPVFLTDKKEAWPMLLQKALAKHYGSYASLSSTAMSNVLETLTGWPAIKCPLQGRKASLSYLQKINSEGYLYVLQGKQGSLLAPAKGGVTYFTLLTFYSRGNKRLALINCPFVDAAWVEKERHEMLALKMLRGHYNCREQMTIWVEQERLREYFNSIVVCPVRSGYQRQTIHVKASQQLYFKVTISGKDEDRVCLYLTQAKTGKLYETAKFEGWYEEKDKVKLDPSDFEDQGVSEFEGRKGQYLLKTEVTPGEYFIAVWTISGVKLELIEESFGVLEWMACMRKSIVTSWGEAEYEMRPMGESHLLVVAKAAAAVDLQGQFDVLEGSKSSAGRVELVKEGQFGYCVVKGRIQEDQAKLVY